MRLEGCDSTVFAPMPNRTAIALVALLSAIFKRAARTDRRGVPRIGTADGEASTYWPLMEHAMVTS